MKVNMLSTLCCSNVPSMLLFPATPYLDPCKNAIPKTVKSSDPQASHPTPQHGYNHRHASRTRDPKIRTALI